MGKYRERMSKVSAMPGDLLAADFCDELDAKMGEVTRRVATIEEQIIALDRKVTDCCDDSARRALHSEVAALRSEVAAIKSGQPASPGPVTG